MRVSVEQLFIRTKRQFNGHDNDWNIYAAVITCRVLHYYMIIHLCPLKVYHRLTYSAGNCPFCVLIVIARKGTK